MESCNRQLLQGFSRAAVAGILDGIEFACLIAAYHIAYNESEWRTVDLFINQLLKGGSSCVDQHPTEARL
jgi:hypothetical protein